MAAREALSSISSLLIFSLFSSCYEGEGKSLLPLCGERTLKRQPTLVGRDDMTAGQGEPLLNLEELR